MPGLPNREWLRGKWGAGEIFNQAVHGRPKLWLLDMARWGHRDLELSSFGGEEGTEVRMVGEAMTENRDPVGLCPQEVQVGAIVALLVMGAKS